MSKKLAALYEVDSRREQSSLPSWVPDWRRKLEVSGITDLIEQRYSCSGSSIPSTKLENNARELTIKGVEWDCVVSTIDSNNSTFMEELVEQLGDTYQATGEPIDDAWIRTVLTDLMLYDPENASLRWNTTSMASFHRLRQRLNQDQADEYAAFLTAMIKNMQNKRFFVTKAGRLGTATDEVRVGDTVAILLGGEAPFILRPVPDGKHQQVGDCYVHGFMDGEALVDVWKKKVPEADHSDTSWLQHLHERPLPFAAQAFTLI